MHTVGPFRVVNDPRVGGWFDLPAAPGEEPTPAVLTITDDGSGVWRVLSTRRDGDTTAGVWVVQAQDTTAVDADAVKADGASGRKALASRPAAQEAIIATGTYPPRPSPAVAGTYLVLARIRKTTEQAQAQVWLGYGPTGTEYANKAVRIEEGATTDWWYYPLGHIQLQAIAGRGAGALPWSLHARDVDGMPGGVQFDHLAFLPADTETCWVRTGPHPVADLLVVDGINRATYRIDAGGAVAASAGCYHHGGIPHLGVRGQGTRVFMLAGVHGGAPAPVDLVSTVTVEYEGRHVHVPPMLTGAPDPVLS